MATTPNYGWVMPDPTDFVTDLPADFEIFGDAVDTTLDTIETKLDVITTEGDLVVGDASGDPVALPIGALGTVLTSDGDTAGWVSPAASGGMTLIATATPTVATTVTFSSIPTTFKTLLLVTQDIRQSSTGVFFSLRLNNDSSNVYNFREQALSNSTTTGVSTQNSDKMGANQASAPIPRGQDNANQFHNYPNGNIWIYNADLTTPAKTIVWQSAAEDGLALGAGNYRGTSAISQIDFIRSSTQTITSGEIRLYGLS